MIEKLQRLIGVRLTARNLRFLVKRAKLYRGNMSEAVRRILEAEETREKRKKSK